MFDQVLNVPLGCKRRLKGILQVKVQLQQISLLYVSVKQVIYFLHFNYFQQALIGPRSPFLKTTSPFLCMQLSYQNKKVTSRNNTNTILMLMNNAQQLITTKENWVFGTEGTKQAEGLIVALLSFHCGSSSRASSIS